MENVYDIPTDLNIFYQKLLYKKDSLADDIYSFNILLSDIGRARLLIDEEDIILVIPKNCRSNLMPYIEQIKIIFNLDYGPILLIEDSILVSWNKPFDYKELIDLINETNQTINISQNENLVKCFLQYLKSEIKDEMPGCVRLDNSLIISEIELALLWDLINLEITYRIFGDLARNDLLQIQDLFRATYYCERLSRKFIQNDDITFKKWYEININKARSRYTEEEIFEKYNQLTKFLSIPCYFIINAEQKRSIQLTTPLHLSLHE